VGGVDLDRAVTLARATIGLAENVPAQAHAVRRLDRTASYVLVQLGEPGEPGWVAAVDPDAGEVMTWAANPSGASHRPERPAAYGAAPAELVYRPGLASRSPLYPLLRVETSEGPRFVDLGGREHLDPGPGPTQGG
jgi:hypothetical protein